MNWVTRPGGSDQEPNSYKALPKLANTPEKTVEYLYPLLSLLKGQRLDMTFGFIQTGYV